LFGGYESVYFVNVPSLLIVFGGTAAVVFLAFPLASIRKSLLAVRKCFAASKIDAKQVARQLVSFSESVRRAGLLAQENRLDEIQDPFLAEGLHLIIDGLPPTTVESILNSEIEAMQHRHQRVRNIVLHCGKCAPAFGMVGTIIGLVMMLTHLDPATIGPGMAIAVLTTLYGLLATNLIFLPIAEKLKQLHDAEVQVKTMIVRGVLGIQSGEHPRIIQLKLQTFLPPDERPGEESERIATIDYSEQAIPFPMEEVVEEYEYEEEMKRAA
jgi:chemotaxis protein MotA